MRTVGRPDAPSGVRAVAMMLGLALVGALTVLVVPRPAGAVRAPGPLAPAEGVLFGAHPRSPNSTEASQRASLLDLESILGRTLAIDHYYRPWRTGEVPTGREVFPTFREQWDFDNGRIPMISWGKTFSSDIIAGIHDAYIRAQADAVAALGQPLFIRWFWEMDGTRNEGFAQSPEAYKAAWQRIRTLWWEQGATNAAFVWCPNATAFDTGEAELYYPGDPYVDWVCADGYNWYTRPGQNNESFRSIYQGFVDWATSRENPKPIMVGEYGALDATSPPDNKANWANAARETLKNDLSAIAAVVYFNSEGYDNDGNWRDWRVNTSPSSLEAFQLMGADPYFNGAPAAPTPQTTLGSGPQGTVTSTSAAFTFSSDQAGATFQCRLDGGGFGPCTSPAAYSALGDGSHTFEVRATTAAGGTDPSCARRTWAVDTTGPAVTGVTPPDGVTGLAAGTSATATFSEAVNPATVTSSSFTLTTGAATVPATVSYNAATRTATLAPTSALQSTTSYTATVKGGPGGVADPLGNRMAADRVWNFTTADWVAPEVTGVTPSDGEMGVPADARPSATFSEPMDPATVTPVNVFLTNGGVTVDATVAYDPATRTARLTPTSPFPAATTYTVTVKGGSGGVADPAGNLLATDRVWRFTTYAPVPETAITTGPPPATVTTAAATFEFVSDQPDAEFQCQLDGGGFGACTSPLTYTALPDGPHTFEVRAWTFAGGTDPTPDQRAWSIDTTPPAVTVVSPAEGATSVAVDSGLSATFSEAVDPATVTPATFVLSNGGSGVDGTVSYDPATRTASLSPATPLQPGATYTVTVKGGAGGVTDPFGNAMAADRVWSFTTAVPPPTTVTFTPTADARVEEARPNTNYGSSSTLKADGGSDPDVESYLRFTVQGVTGTIQKVKLRLYVTDGTGDGPAVYSTGTSWKESGTGSVTWKNRPGRTSGATDDKGRLTSGRWVEFDVTSLVSGNGTFSFVLATRSKDAFAAYSREKSTKRPQLVVTAG